MPEADTPVAQTLHGLLSVIAARYPGKSLEFPTEHEAISYAELDARSRSFAAELASEGVRPGDRVGVLSPSAPEFFVTLFAVTAAGAAACPLPLPLGPRDPAGYAGQLARIAAVAGLRLIVVSPRLAKLTAQIESDLPPPRPRLRPAVLAGGSAAAAQPPPLPARGLSTAADDAVVQFTSGSTADPKGVMLTHGNVLAGLAAISSGAALTSQDVGGLWLPLFHDMGLFGALAGMSAGMTLRVWSPLSFIRSPARWLRAFLGDGTMTAMPNFGYEMLTAAFSPQQAAALDLSRWRIAFNGSEPIAHGTVAAFTERFAPAGFRPQAMFGVYGMAEATLAVTFPSPGRGVAFEWLDDGALANAGRAVAVAAGSPGARAVACVGRPVRGIELRIARPAGAAGPRPPLPDGVVGEIQIRGAPVTSGYLGQSAAEAAASFLPGGWLRTGDLGYRRDGEIYVTGRGKEMITVRGANFYPRDVELIAREVPGVFRGNCVALARTAADGTGSGTGNEEIWLIAETALAGAAAASLAASLRERVAAGLGLAAVTVTLVPPRTIPRTSSGKVRRLASRDAVAMLAGQQTARQAGSAR